MVRVRVTYGKRSGCLWKITTSHVTGRMRVRIGLLIVTLVDTLHTASNNSFNRTRSERAPH